MFSTSILPLHAYRRLSGHSSQTKMHCLLKGVDITQGDPGIPPATLCSSPRKLSLSEPSTQHCRSLAVIVKYTSDKENSKGYTSYHKVSRIFTISPNNKKHQWGENNHKRSTEQLGLHSYCSIRESPRTVVESSGMCTRIENLIMYKWCPWLGKGVRWCVFRFTSAVRSKKLVVPTCFFPSHVAT